MDVIKQHLFLIVCGLVAAGGIVLGATGMSRMSRVPAEMNQAKDLYESLGRLRTGAANQRWIDQEKRRIESQIKDFEAVQKNAEMLNGGAGSDRPYKPLMEDLFPKGAGRTELREQFRRAYGPAYDALVARLHPGVPPSSADILDVDDEIFRETQQPDFRLPPPEEQWTAGGVLTSAGATLSASARAAIGKAQRMWCYVTPGGGDNASFYFEPSMANVDALEPPTATECWFAQVHLWIEEDVIEAILRINQAVAGEHIAAGRNPWVGNLPIKDIISLRMTYEYVVGGSSGVSSIGSSRADASDRSIARPPSDPEDAFTGSETDADFQVVYFTLKVVMDERVIPRLIEEVSKDRFHVLLGVSYQAVEPNPEMKGRIYGDAPSVIAVFDFEAHMMPSFWDMMPFEVYQRYFPE